MIQITAYLRDQEDLRRWKEVKNKAGFLHDALQGMSLKLPDKIVTSVKLANKEIPFKQNKGLVYIDTNGHNLNEIEIIKTPEDAKKVVEEFSGFISKSHSARKKRG